MLLSNIPSGMRYYSGAEARLRRSVENIAMSVFEGWSYEEVITPSIDYYLLFEQGMGQAEAQSSFRFADVDGRMLSLRPDVTSSVARLAATLLAEQERPLRFCYAAPVFRRFQQSHAEWRRENTQLGCELIGLPGQAADLEILLVAAEILTQVGLSDKFCITINNVGIFNSLVEELGLDSSEREIVRRLVDTRDETELKGFFLERSVSGASCEALLQLCRWGGKGTVLRAAQDAIKNGAAKNALVSLQTLWQVIESVGLQDSFEIDLADVSSLDYYTGLSFKVFLRGVGYRVGRGGRYDGLTANFGAAEPAVGFVLTLDALTEVLARQREDGDAPLREVSAIKSDELHAAFTEAISLRSRKKLIKIDSET